jgi:acetoin utilization protein AcuC
MTGKVALVTVGDDVEGYDFGASHPLRPERILLTYENIATLPMGEVTEVGSRIATEAEVLRAHDADFVETIKAIDAGAPGDIGFAFGLGSSDNPIFPGMHDAASAVCGATIVAAERVASGEFMKAFNPAGGLHHARRREASGFCIYNDPAVAIAHVLSMHPDWRVMYVDVDVHHGDGVQWIFYDNPQVLTVSLHQSGHYLYPGTGFEDEIGEGEGRGTSANIPLLPFTGEEDYLFAAESLLPALARAYKPQMIVTQLGADTHHGDPLANLALTMPAYPRLARILSTVADRFCEGRWVATGGGGYQAETVVPKVWTMHFAEMCGAPEAIPSDWLHDKEPEEVCRPNRATVERSVERVISKCVPLLEGIAS